MIYVGLDVHKRFSYVSAMNESGKTITQKKIQNNPNEFKALFESFGDDKVSKVVFGATQGKLR